MERFILNKKVLKLSEVKLVNSKVLPWVVSAELSPADLAYLSVRGIVISKEHSAFIPLGIDYPKYQSNWQYANKSGLTGAGCKVGDIGTGCSISDFYNHAYNTHDGGSDVTDGFGHDTLVCSIIKSPNIGMAKGCDMHVFKVTDDLGVATEQAILDAIALCISLDLDVVCMPFQFDTPTFRTAIADLQANNCVIFASSGNASTETDISFPAALPGVQAVNNIHEDGSIGNKSVLIPSGGTHGISYAIGGVNAEVITRGGTHTGFSGTSYSSPVGTGIYACYHEKLGISDNYRVLQHMENRAKKHPNQLYFNRIPQL